MLEVHSVEVMYMNVIQVLKGLSLSIDEGKITALLGANGAGKTTALKAISGLLKTEEGKITEGYIKFLGQRIDRYAPEYIAALGIIQVMEGRMVLEHLTVRENLMVGAYCRKDKVGVEQSFQTILHYFPRLTSLLNHTSGFLSGGEQQMLVMGRALMAQPKLLLLDEPSLGLAPLVVEEIFNIIEAINSDQHTCIVLVEQNAKLALDVADYGYVMEDGRVVLDGSADKLRNNEDIKEFYLGLSQIKQKSYREVKHYRRRKRWLG
jgi:branched-chain amino acid transport system ATP-binding protein